MPYLPPIPTIITAAPIARPMIARAMAIIGHAVCRSKRSSASWGPRHPRQSYAVQVIASTQGERRETTGVAMRRWRARASGEEGHVPRVESRVQDETVAIAYGIATTTIAVVRMDELRVPTGRTEHSG